jgi:uncharacterized protein YukE/predicted alpha/beta hydrolase family esterase
MSKPTVPQVCTWLTHAQALTDTAVEIDSAVDVFDASMNDISRFVSTTMQGWQGDAAEASQARADAEVQVSNRLAITILDIADDINRLGPDIVHSCRVARDRANSIAWLGYLVADDGGVTAPTDSRPGYPTDIPASLPIDAARVLADRKAGGHQEWLMEALAAAGQADSTLAVQIAKTLGELALNAERATTPVPLRDAVQELVDGRRQLPSDPYLLKTFWDGLTSAEKAALWDSNRDIGNMDGIPVADRDHFNRRYLAELETRARDVIANDHAGEDVRAQAEHDLATLAAVQSTLAREVDGKKRYLMQIDTRGHGAISVNNPDTAANVVTYVPGTGANLSKMGGGVDRADRMVRAASPLGTTDTAAIAWFGYDAPPDIGAAGSGAPASRGAQPLVDLQDGLRATHEGATPSHNTIVSHSYGTVVAAEAASGDRELNVDDLVFVASPGLGGPDDVNGLNLTGPDDRPNSERVWATVASNDWINSVEIVLGPDPHDAGFGARVFTSDDGPGISTAAHSKYWDEGSESLANIARIVTGRYAVVD